MNDEIERLREEVDARESGDLTVCPLCDQPILEDEETREVWHSAPTPRALVIKGVAEADERVAGGGKGYVLGKPLGEIAAMISALESEERVSLDTASSVEEVRAVGHAGVKDYAEMPADGPVVQRNDDKAGATIRIEPPDSPSPDAVMHEWCHESVFNGDET